MGTDVSAGGWTFDGINFKPIRTDTNINYPLFLRLLAWDRGLKLPSTIDEAAAMLLKRGADGAAKAVDAAWERNR